MSYKGPKKLWLTDCKKCQKVTLHTEDLVPDKESATVWHCLYCGQEFRPYEPGNPNEPALI